VVSAARRAHPSTKPASLRPWRNAGRVTLLIALFFAGSKEFKAGAPSRVVAIEEVGADEMILDIGPRAVEHVISVLARVKKLVWNGPFGAFELEPFDIGTIEVAEAAAELTAAGKLTSVAGGGDTVAALNVAGVTERFTYVSTAGGAFLEWMEGKALLGVEVLRAKGPAAPRLAVSTAT
jgi:phosphoglycerate kinase